MATPVTHWNTAEGFADGAAVTAGASGGDSGMPFQTTVNTGGGVITASSPGIHGNRSYRMVAGSGAVAILVWGNFNTRKLAQRACLRIDSIPTSTTQIMLNRSDQTTGRIFVEGGTGRLGLQNARGASTTKFFSAIPSYPLDLRLEMVTDIDGRHIWGGWAVGDGEFVGLAEISDTDLGPNDLNAAHVGKLNASAWVADIRVDDVAMNTQSLTPIGPWAESYTEPSAPPTLTINKSGLLEPGESFNLTTGGGGSAPVQKRGEIVTLTEEGGGAWYSSEAPYTVEGTTLVFEHSVPDHEEVISLEVDVLPSVIAKNNGYGLVPVEVYSGTPTTTPAVRTFTNRIFNSGFVTDTIGYASGAGSIISRETALDIGVNDDTALKISVQPNSSIVGSRVSYSVRPQYDYTGQWVAWGISASRTENSPAAVRLVTSFYDDLETLISSVQGGVEPLAVQPLSQVPRLYTSARIPEGTSRIEFSIHPMEFGDLNPTAGVLYSDEWAATIASNAAYALEWVDNYSTVVVEPVDAIISGVVYAENKPLDGVSVNLYRLNADLTRTWITNRITPADGRFTFPARATGDTYLIYLQPNEPGFENRWNGSTSSGAAGHPTATRYLLDRDLNLVINLVGSFPVTAATYGESTYGDAVYG